MYPILRNFRIHAAGETMIFRYQDKKSQAGLISGIAA
jgi:hypothetical protein